MMKNILFIILFICIFSCKAQQIYSLRSTEIDLAQNSYEKDTNNELPEYEGTWTGVWSNKTILITFKKLTYKYDNNTKRYRDYLIGKFIVKDINGNVLFNNTNLSDDQAKIEGIKIFPNGKYLLTYVDADLCLKSGRISIEFTNPTKTEMKFKFMETSQLIDSECFYHGKPVDQRPEPLPKEIILTKQ